MGETVCLGSYNLLTDKWLACPSGYLQADDTRIIPVCGTAVCITVRA